MKISIDNTKVSSLSGKQGGKKEGGKIGIGNTTLKKTIPDNRARGVRPTPSDKGSFGTGAE